MLMTFTFSQNTEMYDASIIS